MGSLLKITVTVILICAMAAIGVKIASATVEPRGTVEVCGYQPLDRGGPDSSQSAGTR